VVELLVVVALVVLVVSLAIPATKSVRNRAAQAVEVSAARQLLVAWTGYATDHAGAILPGYRNGLPAFDENGQSIATQTIGVAAARYPWRIAPYLGHDFRGLYLDANLRTLEELAATDRSNYLYQTSVFPSLGLNTTFVGGDENDGCFSPAYLNVYGKFFVDRLSRVRHTERLLVCASARGADPQSGFGESILDGWFRVRSPMFTASRWGERYLDEDAASCGHVARRNGARTVCGFVAGHVEVRTPDELRDMRFWADQADAVDWVLEPQ
jgi:type II secretory pathway pseudopilin PulG